MNASKTLLLSAVVIVGLVASLGCNNLSGPNYTSDDTIPEITGISLLKNGVEILEITSTYVKGKIEIVKEQNADVYEVRFRDENKNTIDLSEKLYRLDHIFIDDIASLKNSEQLDKFQFFLYGHRSGQTKLSFVLMRGMRYNYKSPHVTLAVK